MTVRVATGGGHLGEAVRRESRGGNAVRVASAHAAGLCWVSHAVLGGVGRRDPAVLASVPGRVSRVRDGSITVVRRWLWRWTVTWNWKWNHIVGGNGITITLSS